jgi:nitrite reductase (NO-forming)
MDTSVAPHADLSKTTRIKRKLVRPPFVPEHEQIAPGAPGAPGAPRALSNSR